MSRWMRGLIAFGAACFVGFSASAWFDSDFAHNEGVRGLLRAAGIAGDPPLSAAMLTALQAIGLPHFALTLFSLLQAWRLFGAYARGNVFGAQPVSHLRALAWALLATTIWHTLSGTLGVLLLTWGNPPGQRRLVIGISWDEYLSALLAGLLIAVAWAMLEAGRIERDNAGFV